MRNWIKEIVAKRDKYWTNYLGLARTFLALSTLLTLLGNNTTTLFYSGLMNENHPKIDSFSFLNVYTWFGSLEYGYWFSCLVLLAVVIGVLPRITCLFHWLVTFSFFSTSAISDGGDQIAAIITFLLIPICLFDKRFTHWDRDDNTNGFYANAVASTFHFLIRIQAFAIYFFASVGKFSSLDWKNGTALYYWFTEPLFGAEKTYDFILLPILESPFLTTMMTWTILAMELFIAFNLFIADKKINTIAFWVGIVFHLGILFIFGLVSFFLTMSALLVMFLISKNENYGFSLKHFSFNPRNRNILLLGKTKEH